MALAVDYRQRGRLVHDVLAEFHRRTNEVCGGPASPARLEPEDYDRLLAEALAEVLHSHESNPVKAALRQVDRRLHLAETA